jgi:hypothetical protein
MMVMVVWEIVAATLIGKITNFKYFSSGNKCVSWLLVVLKMYQFAAQVYNFRIT